MARPNRNMIVTIAGILAAALLAGCGTTASIESREDFANHASTGTVIFGKFRLIRNGTEANVGNSLFGTTVLIQVDNDRPEHSIVGKVGDDGEFAWALEPGNYVISSIAFDNRGERQETDAHLAFTVSGDHKAVYIGTITLEASLDSGYYGTNGSVDDFQISNDCGSECQARLQALGLSTNDMTVSLMQEQYQLARTN